MPTGRQSQLPRLSKQLFLLLPLLLLLSTVTPIESLNARIANKDRLLRVLDSTSRLIDAFTSDPDHVNADGFFGLQLTQSLLAAPEVRTAAVGQVSGGAIWQLESILTRLSLLVQRVGHRLATANGHYDAFTLARICEPIIARFGALTSAGGGGRPAWWHVETADGERCWPEEDREILGAVSRLLGYDEQRGDACLVDALQPSGDGSSCPTRSSPCAYFQRPLKQASGYYLSHQLLYRMITELNPCRKPPNGSPPSLSAQVTQMCRKIFTEFKFIEAANWTQIERAAGKVAITGLRDLYMEQALLCGLTGAGDFFREASLETVAAWQDPEIGCFKLYSSEESRDRGRADSGLGGSRRILRDSEMMGGCSSHSSGVAAGFYGNAIRFLLRV